MSQDAAVTEAVEVEPVADADAEAQETEAVVSEEQAEQPEKSEDDQPSESSPEKKDDGVQARIDEITRYRREAERERDYWKQQAEQKSQAAPVEEGKTLADFEYDEKAFIEYSKTLARQEAQQEVTRWQQEQQTQALRSKFSQREAEFAKANTDYYQVAHFAPISDQVAGLVLNAEKGPELAYYLGQNPDIAESISRLPLHQAAIEIGRIEAGKLIKAKPSISSAPPPPPKIGAVDSKVQEDPAKMSQTQFEKWRAKHIAKR